MNGGRRMPQASPTQKQRCNSKTDLGIDGCWCSAVSASVCVGEACAFLRPRFMTVFPRIRERKVVHIRAECGCMAERIVHPHNRIDPQRLDARRRGLRHMDRGVHAERVIPRLVGTIREIADDGIRARRAKVGERG
jgi:hypothetical protein